MRQSGMQRARVLLGWMVAALVGVAAAGPAGADVFIGQTAGFSGTVAGPVKEASEGAKLWFDAVNARGGIAGQPVTVLALDDHFDPKTTATNAKALIDRGVLALFLTRGTPHNQALLPLLEAEGVPLVGPSTGAMVLHQPVQRWVFNVRAPYQHEAERLTRHLLSVGASRIAVVQVDDSFGDDAVKGVQKAMAGKPLAAHERYKRDQPDFGPLARRVAAAEVHALVFIGSGSAVVTGIKALRAAGCTATVGTLSNLAYAGFAAELGPAARGIIVSQVLPPVTALGMPVVREATDLLHASGKPGAVTPAMLEGFISAKVLVEGLKRAAAAKDLSRAGLQRALDALGRYDLGGLELSYSPTDHTGLDYADLSIIGADGQFKR